MQAMDSTDTRSAVDVVVPISFVVPNAGKLLTLLFVPFAAWLAGDPMGADAYLALFGAGIPSYFAKAQVALPFLMDLLGVPHDLFHLYIPVEHRHRQVRFDGHGDEPAGAGAADGQRSGGPPADRAASHRARRC